MREPAAKGMGAAASIPDKLDETQAKDIAGADGCISKEQLLDTEKLMETSAVPGSELDAPETAVTPSGWALGAEVLATLTEDNNWSDEPFWLLVCCEDESHKVQPEALEAHGGKKVLSGYSRTLMGVRAFSSVEVLHWPSPEKFASAAASGSLWSGVDPSRPPLLIPTKAGWLNDVATTPTKAPTARLTHFTVDNVWSTPSGVVGEASEGARLGLTSSSREQAEGFVSDDRIGARAVWHLNLMDVADMKVFMTYAGMLGQSGTLSTFGGKPAYSASIGGSLTGGEDFGLAGIVTYTCRDAYLTMGATPDYIAAAAVRHKALRKTYIISIVPDIVEDAPDEDEAEDAEEN